MNPGVLLGVVVNVVFGVLTIAAAVLPWRWSSLGAVGGGAKSVACAAGVIATGVLWMYTLADAQITGPGGGAIWCGGSYAFMLDPGLQEFEGLPRECIIHSWIAIVLLLALAITVLAVQHYALRLLARHRRRAGTRGRTAR